MIPPLGSQDPETRHLNLRWTVGDMDRINFARLNPSMTAEQIAVKLVGTGLACPSTYIRHLCREFGMNVRAAA